MIPPVRAPALLSAGCLVLACVVTVRPGAGRARLRGHTLPARSRALAPAVTTAAVVVVSLGVGWLAVAVIAFVAVRHVRRRRAAHRAATETAAAVPLVCRAIAADVRAGAPPGAALARAAPDAPPPLAGHLARLATAIRLGNDPPPERWADLPGGDDLRSVAALWHVATGAGAGLADGLDRLAEALAAEQRRRADLAAQLAGPYATAAALAALPVCGLALAGSLGAHPVTFLLRTPVGLGCAFAGVVLDVLGLWWVRRIAARASP